MSSPSESQSSKTSKTSSHKSSKSKSSKSKPKTRRKRRGSGTSNASIISIDYASLKKLRKFQAKLEKENKKQKILYQQQKQSAFEDYTKKFIEQDKLKYELKEEYEDDGYDSYKTTKKNKHGGRSKKTDSYFDENYDTNISSYDSSGSSYTKDGGQSNNNQNQMDTITVEELVPIIKNLADRYTKLQEEYDILDREYREQKILMEDRISQLQQEDMSITSDTIMKDHDYVSIMRDKLIQEYEDKIEIVKNNYEDNLLRVQSQYQHEIDQQNKQIKSLNKELNDGDKEKMHYDKV